MLASFFLSIEVRRKIPSGNDIRRIVTNHHRWRRSRTVSSAAVRQGEAEPSSDGVRKPVSGVRRHMIRKIEKWDQEFVECTVSGRGCQ